ncbi:MAG: polyphenol oxidase family protein [Gemmatimonadota bacterium]
MSALAADRIRMRREEKRTVGPFAVFANAEWEGEFPGLSAGITAAAPRADFGLGTAPSPLLLLQRYEALAAGLGFESVVVCRQVHGSRVVGVEAPVPRGFHSPGEGDGLACEVRGVLLVVTAADCVPVYLLDPVSRALVLLHAGWRGTASGVLEAGAWLLATRVAAPPGRLFLHLGPAICGGCYEVGGEVLAAMGRPGVERGRVDLRDELTSRALSLGMDGQGISRSPWCTRCESGLFHSHRARGESAGRMAAYLGWRSAP